MQISSTIFGEKIQLVLVVLIMNMLFTLSFDVNLTIMLDSFFQASCNSPLLIYPYCYMEKILTYEENVLLFHILSVTTSSNPKKLLK